jgi:hypothetical protein
MAKFAAVRRLTAAGPTAETPLSAVCVTINWAEEAYKLAANVPRKR